MRLHELKPDSGTIRKKRKGRGIGSGLGKTAGRGQKGQKARSGGGVRPGFEGGQMPLQQRLPKRGCTNIYRREFSEVNVDVLNNFENDTVVTPELLVEGGYVKNLQAGLKVLGRGELERNLVVKAHKFSKAAVEKIEAAGGKAEVI